MDPRIQIHTKNIIWIRNTLPLQVFASVILENQVDRNKSVFKRMRIADTNSLAGERFPGCSTSGKKVKLVQQQQQLLQQEGGSLYHANYSTMGGGGNFFQGGGGGGHVYAQQAALGRRAAPPIRQNMFLIPISRYECSRIQYSLTLLDLDPGVKSAPVPVPARKVN
jgi:hypothetical protein